MSETSIQPDPSFIGGISKAPYVLLPNAESIFRERSIRLDRLSEVSHLRPYLRFLADVARLQHAEATEHTHNKRPDNGFGDLSRDAAMPCIDRSKLAISDAFSLAARRFLVSCADLEVPAPAAAALSAITSANDDDLAEAIANVLADSIPADRLPEHVFVAAAVQIIMAKFASGLDPSRLVPVSVGVCPVCGGKPAGSLVIGFHGAEGARYAVCACCATKWNEVRVKCLVCGSTKGVGYRSVEAQDGDGDATVKAEVCDECNSWTKILYQNKNPSLEMIADDVASLGLDYLLNDSDYKRAGFNPFLIGY